MKLLGSDLIGGVLKNAYQRIDENFMKRYSESNAIRKSMMQSKQTSEHAIRAENGATALLAVFLASAEGTGLTFYWWS